jgi:DNA/RNA endonuclease YhcR with UshA esterase domain
MKTKTVAALFAVAVTALAIAQTPPTYPPEEAAKHVGETATITGKVDGFRQSGGNIFLNMGGKDPNQSFMAFIPSESVAQFPHVEQYDGRTVGVTGKIESYKGKPEIVVTSPSQISMQ